MLTCNSFFSGIGGFDLGFERAGIKTLAQVEFDEKARAVLARHFPSADRSITDIRDARVDNLPIADVWCGGFPCQDLSVAGKRKGLAGERSGLWYEFHRLIVGAQPEWVVIENVPGLLSSNDGRDFAILLGGLAGRIPAVPGAGWGNAGFIRGSFYSVAYRVLDAQFFGVAQRRRRVFIVGHLGDGRAAEVLFEREGSPGDTPPRREAGERTASTLRSGSDSPRAHGKQNGTDRETLVADALTSHNGGADVKHAQANQLTVAHETGKGFWTEGLPGLRANPGGMPENLVARSLTSRQSRLDGDADNFVAYNIQHNDGGAHKRADRPNGGMYVNETDVALTVGTTDLTAIAFQQNTRDEVRLMGGDGAIAGALSAEPGMHQQNFMAFQSSQSGVREVDAHATLDSNNGSRRQNGVASPAGVRRLMPVECERLQGFPDDWTAGQADSARYKQLGNAVAVPCAEWIGRRIMQVVNQEA